MTRNLPSLTTALIGASIILTTACGSKPPTGDGDGAGARPAKIVTVGVAESSARTYPGRVQAAQRVPLAFRVGGPVIEIRVGKGQPVKSGELLARIDPRDYEVQVKNLEAQLAATRAQEIQAAEGYQRVRGLYEHDNASKADFENGKASLDVSRAQVEATEQALKAARLSLADTELRAPYDGTVGAGQPIVRFQGAGGMEVVIHVPEREVAEITGKAPTEILVRFDALTNGETLPARVKEFATETDSQTQTFPVTLELEGHASADLLPGMTASVDWHTGHGTGRGRAMVVPLEAVATGDSGQPFVWRVDPKSMKIERVDVATGALTKSGLEIVSGLQPSDRILAAGVHFVTEGQEVRPLAADKD